MQPGYRSFPQQPPQRSPHGLAPNARRGAGPVSMMAPGVAHQMAPMLPGHGHAPMTPQQHAALQQSYQPLMTPQHGGPMPLPMSMPMAMPMMAMPAAHAPPHMAMAPQPHLGHHPGVPMPAPHHAPPHAHAHHLAPHHPQQAAVAQQQAAAAAQAAQAAAAQQAAHHASEAAKRRSRKPTDKTMPDGVEEIIVGDGVQRYRDLRDLERRLDATMTRKRLDIVDSMQRHLPKRAKTLRIWITNTAANQLWQAGAAAASADTFDYAAHAAASYEVKIEGRVLDDDDGEPPAGTTAGEAMDVDQDKNKTDAAAAEPRYHFTQFFRAVTVDFPNRPNPPTADAGPKPVEWRRPERPAGAPGQPQPAAAAVPELDELTFRRPGDENVHITINLFRHEEPERFALDAVLADIVDMAEATRAEAVMGLFEYIRLQNLQEDEEKRNFRCDDLLRQLVGNDVGYIPLLQEYVNQHIRPLPPVALPYTIRVDAAFFAAGAPPATVYDVRVAVDDPLRAQLRPFVQSPQYMGLLRDVAGLDDQLAVLVQAIGMSKSKHEFLAALARDPARFVRAWLSSQKRDLDVIMGESERGAAGAGAATGDLLAGDAWRRGGHESIWASQNARESVTLLMAKLPLIPRGQ